MCDDVGVTYILDKLQVLSPYGKHAKKKLMCYTTNERDMLVEELNRIQEIIQSIDRNQTSWEQIREHMVHLRDIRHLVENLTPHTVLDEVALFAIKYFAIGCQKIHEIYKGLENNVDIHIESMAFILQLLNPEGEDTTTFYIYDHYHEELKTIRQEKIKLEKAVFATTDHEKITSLKAERLNYVAREEAIVRQVRKHLSSLIYGYRERILENMEKLGRLDMLQAKGQLAITYGCSRPQITEHLHIEAVDAWHQQVADYLQDQNKGFVPVSIEMRAGVTIITGANMGGKSVALKTMMLNMILTHMGFYVFANKLHCPIVDGLYYISDDLQSVSRGISTFGAEILSINAMTRGIRGRTGFVILDEFARGTNPREGALLLRALCTYLQEQQCMSLLATHYDGIVQEGMNHYQVVGLKYIKKESLQALLNSHETKSAIGLIQEQMDFRLELVQEELEVPREAITVAELLGVDQEIIQIARGMNKQGEELTYTLKAGDGSEE